jgi:protein SCO1/2
LLVSVDPSRDTPEKLAQYIAYFNEEFIALTGDHGVLFPFARNLGMMYAINEPEGDEADNNGYLVDHSASLVLINPQGDIAAIFKPRQALGVLPTIDGEKLVSDFAKIVKLAE